MGQAVVVNQGKKHSIEDIRKNYKKHFKNIEQFHEFLTDFGIEWSKSRMKSGNISEVQDKILAQMSNAVDHLVKTENELIERLKETYVLIDPSFEGTDKQLISKIVKDHEELKEYALLTQSLMQTRKQVENEIKEKAVQVMPNFSAAVEPLIAAKLLAMAGSIQKLASMSSSTIQLLGAEKALFRHLKNRNSKSPKYGIIYNSIHIQNMPRDIRGKAARILASKLMVAARIDYYGKRDDSQKLKDDLKQELQKLMEARK